MSSEKQSSQSTDIADTPVDNDDVEKEDEVEATEDFPAGQPAAGKASGAVAWFALVIAFVAVIAVAALGYFSFRGASEVAAERDAGLATLTGSLGATQDALASLEQSISALNDRDAEKDALIKSLGTRLDDRLRQLESLPGRLNSVEASMAAVQGISTGARDAWLLAETEYYMQIANAQLQLANNPELASLALTHADDRLLQLGDPRLTNVRQALSDELRALEVIEKPDSAGITLTLASLAGVVDSLPLRHEVVVREGTTEEIDPNLSGMDRAMASLRNAVGGVVSVRRADEAMQPLIAPEAQYFLRANLALQLQAARLALLRGEEQVFRQSLDDAIAWLNEYYDPGNAGVESARATLAEIRGSVFSVAMPDISRSLRLLRRFNSLATAAQPDDVEPEQ